MSSKSKKKKVAELAAKKLLGQASCATCQFLYFQATGYSNYTVLETEVRCALDKNPNLPAGRPYDWSAGEDHDNWPATQNSRCLKHRSCTAASTLRTNAKAALTTRKPSTSSITTYVG